MSEGGNSARATPVPGARPPSSSGQRKQNDNSGGGVQVLVRTRPANQFELKEQNNYVCFTVVDSATCMLKVEDKRDPFPFTFDWVFGQTSRQIEVFEAAGKPTVENVLNGFNSTIFAYGQTGAGKTHTMVGNLKDEEQRGLTPRVFVHMFERMDEEVKSCSNLEIYNETITDLLTPGSSNLPIRQHPNGTGCFVDGLKELDIVDANSALDLMEQGTNSRTVSATNANLTSSRSHCVFTCVITREQKDEGGQVQKRVSRLNLVDLAGSERAKVSDGKNRQTLIEGCNINKSLTCLGRVIKELVESQSKGKAHHVPYRDSKLTSLLQESLGGNAKTIIIAGVSPVSSSAGESLSTLQFVQRAKKIKNSASQNVSISADVTVLQKEVLKLRGIIEKMKKGDPSVKNSASPAPLPKKDPDSGNNSNGSSSNSCGGGGEPDPEILKKLKEKEDMVLELEHQLNASMSANTNLKETARSLEAEVIDLKNMKEVLDESLEVMMNQFDDLQVSSQHVDEVAQKLFEAEKAIVRQEIESYHEQVKLQKAETQKREEDIKKLNDHIEQISSELNDIRQKNSVVSVLLDEANDKIATQTSELKRITQDHEQALSCISEIEKREAELKESYELAINNLSEKNNEIEKLKELLEEECAKLNASESNNFELSEKINLLEKNKKELEDEVSHAKKDIKSLENEIDITNKELKMYQDKCTELEDLSVELYKEISILNEINGECEAEKAKLKEELKSTQNSVLSLDEQRSEFQVLTYDLESRLVSLSNLVSQKENDIKSHKQLLNESQMHLQEHEEKRVELEKMNIQLKEDIQNYLTINETLMNEKNDLNKQYEETKEHYNNVISEKDKKYEEMLKTYENDIAKRDEIFMEHQNGYEKEIADKKKEHEKTLNDLRNMINKKEEELEETKSILYAEIEGYRKKLDEVIEEHRKVTEDERHRHLSHISEMSQKSKEELEKLEKEHEEVILQLRNEISRAERQLKDKTAKLNSEIQDLLDKHQVKTEEYEFELSEKNKKYDDMCKKFENEIKALKKEMDNVSERHRKESELKGREFEEMLYDLRMKMEDKEKEGQNTIRKLKEQEIKLRELNSQFQDEMENKENEIAELKIKIQKESNQRERKLAESKARHELELKDKDMELEEVTNNYTRELQLKDAKYEEKSTFFKSKIDKNEKCIDALQKKISDQTLQVYDFETRLCYYMDMCNELYNATSKFSSIMDGLNNTLRDTEETWRPCSVASSLYSVEDRHSFESGDTSPQFQSRYLNSNSGRWFFDSCYSCLPPQCQTIEAEGEADH